MNHIVRCRADDWQIGAADAERLERLGHIWLDTDATERSNESEEFRGEPEERVYGVTGESESDEEDANALLVERAERRFLAAYEGRRLFS